MKNLPEGAVTLQTDGLYLDVALLAPMIGLSVQGWREQMDRGLIHAKAERGAGKDEGRWRIIVRHKHQRLEIILYPDGRACARHITRLGRALNAPAHVFSN